MSRTRLFLAASLGLALLRAPASGAEGPYAAAIAAARRSLWQAVNSGRCASATAAIMADGKVVYSEGFAMADRERAVPVDRDTRFNMGSISKVYVAAAIMLLVDDGKVALDQPVTEYLPDFKMADERYQKITVRMLLNHTSGLPGTQAANSVAFAYHEKFRQETLATLAQAHLKHEPGARAVYCNDGFTLAEMIVERRSGQKYPEFLAQRVFKPLGLERTGVSVGDLRGQPAALYYDPQTGKPHPLESLSLLGAGGLSATSEDLCRFAEVFQPGTRLFRDASLAEMRKAQPSASWGKLRHPE
ncbi:MAG: serine hydrolase, partial [Elusimicrobia bacterium]|nr:serine hydrolase [Elusimicrobiota bacterium]